MAEFAFNAEQNIPANQPIPLQTVIGCNRGYVLHREGSGILTLRGIVNNPCSGFARYQVLFKSNIAVPTGETVGPIDLAITIDGEPIPTSIVEVTPAAVEEYFGVVTFANITVPKGCCINIAIENVTEDNIPILARNSVLDVIRTA